jgi:cytochrome c oxidase subunit 2
MTNGTPRSVLVRLAGRMRSLLALVAAMLLTGCGFGMDPGRTVEGRHISDLYRLLFWFAIPIAAIVYGGMLWSILRYRRRRGDDGTLPKQVRYNLPIELVYTAIPVVIVLILFAFTLSTMNKVDAQARSPAVTVDVTGFRWQWRFAFPGEGFTVTGTKGSPTEGPTIIVPVGQTVRFNLSAADVIHSFFVPAFNFKRDAIPGVTNHFDMRIDRPGVYRGECAEFCGLDHADMTFYLRAVSPAEYRAWVDQYRNAGVIVGGAP